MFRQQKNICLHRFSKSTLNHRFLTVHYSARATPATDNERPLGAITRGT